MRSLIAYFLGILTVLIILIPFWYVAKSNTKIKQVYDDVFCNSVNAASTGGSNLVAPTTTTTGRTIGGNNNGSVYGNGGNATSSSAGSGVSGGVTG